MGLTDIVKVKGPTRGHPGIYPVTPAYTLPSYLPRATGGKDGHSFIIYFRISNLIYMFYLKVINSSYKMSPRRI
jgi:hypothetical protein